MHQFKVDSATGLLSGIKFVPSPNCDDRPAGLQIDVLVIHCISLPPGSFGGTEIEKLFCNRLDPAAHPYFAGIADLKVSAHLLVRRDGEVVQFVPLQKRAWHAGVSQCEGRPRVNDFSIGIELEGTEHSAFEPVQYEVLADLTRSVMVAFPAISPARIYGHSDVAPGRKTDPGPYFDWQRYRQMLA